MNQQVKKPQESIQQLRQTSLLSGGNLDYVEGLFESWMANATSVPEEWQRYFSGLPGVNGKAAGDVSHASIINALRGYPKRGAYAAAGDSKQAGSLEHEAKQVSVSQLITAYRVRGHQHSQLDPLGLMHRDTVADLTLEFHHLSPADNNTVFTTQPTYIPQKAAKLGDLVPVLEDIYCSSIGYEYMAIDSLTEKQWIQKRNESSGSRPKFSKETRLHILERLSAAEGLEKHLDSKYPGTKRFGLEGGESLIHALDDIIQRAGEAGTKEIVIGMAHRGRLNVLVNTLGKNPSVLFDEFEGRARYNSSGDVKYHQGFSSNLMTAGGEVHCSMAFNPSHLEIVNPVVEGSVRARQHRHGDHTGDAVLPLLIHGDAAFSGQGVVMETLALSQTRGYKTGGTVHIVVNNQIGFTTSDTRDARSSLYCTDIVKMVEAPVFHVNGDDPEAVVMVARIALEYRMTFHKDVVIDLVCFRRLGHNEQDEPFVTQPLMYKKIAQHPGTRKLYADKLEKEGAIPQGHGDELVTSVRGALDAGKGTNSKILYGLKPKLLVDWAPYFGVEWRRAADTAVTLEKLKTLARRLTDIPPSFKLHPTVERMLAARREMGEGKVALDWGMAENLAYASLVDEKHPVRFSGQDAGRGTFAHRHAVLHDQNREKWDSGVYIPLQNIREGQANFVVIDSLLSEEAVLGFEYGYATAQPFELVIWEAQFGDFVNGAQVVIDQFIAAGEAKWGRLCGLTMFLPHGYEGQGPEHSSARLERFLQLCAEHNIQVCVPSTPAQLFHMVRRQMIRPMRKPLIVMMPKSLLRKKESSSPLADLAKGGFQVVIPEIESLAAKKVKRVVFCSGKVYFDIVAERAKRSIDDVAVVRIEQLYPFPHDEYGAQIALYPSAKSVVWCQEEPRNQGAWRPIQHYLTQHMRPDQELTYAGRESAASPAVGYLQLHAEQQRTLVDAALTIGAASKKEAA
jgi:2-oxoglutarate dehydrogenase E1 component